MDAAFVAARAVHFGATMLVFGELVFAVLVAPGRWARTIPPTADAQDTLDRHARAFVAWALAASAVSGAAWLLLEAGSMAGATIGEAVRDGTIPVVLRDTEFGRVFVLRTLLGIALVASLGWMHRARGRSSRASSSTALVVAAAFLATLAGAGHAAAASGATVRAVHLGADAAHLLAAGAWLGALAPLAHCMARAGTSEALVRLARRFSVLGIACVAVLVASGIVNALYLVGSFAALFGTAYGQLLDVKLALFALMIAIAAINRSRLTPRLAHGDAARRALARNARIELACGIVIVAIVGALGTMVPGAHQSPRWPFGFTLDVTLQGLSGGRLAALATSVALALAAIAIIIVGMRRRALRWSIPGCAALVASAVVSTSIFAVPAFPTSYAASPVPDPVDAVANGAAQFAKDCSSCHGSDARGNGPAAAALSTKPADLAEHALHHPQGNLFWWIAHGISGTPMPAFSPQIADDDIWAIVQFLVARASAEAAMSLGSRIDVESMSRAPDFAYEVPGDGEHTLAGERSPALIVVYATRESEARIAQLATDPRIAHSKLRVIPIPLTGLPAADAGYPVVASNVPGVYRMFAGSSGTMSAAHVELLVDGAGYLRARWTGIPANARARDADIANALQRLPAKPSDMPASMHHGHP